MTTPHVVILGGGITGLSAAFAFKQAVEGKKIDLTCTVLEKDARLGGKISTHREGGFVMETGPDSILGRKPAGVQLIRELGIESEVVGTNPTAHKTFILSRGRLEKLPPGTNMGIPTQFKPFATTKILSFGAKVKALKDLFYRPSPMTGDQSLGAFLRHHFGDELVNRMAEPLMAGIYAGNVNELSLRATFPQFGQMEEKYGSIIRGLMAARKAAPPPNNSGRSVFITLRGGLETLIERLYDCLHEFADLKTQAAATRIEKSSDSGYIVTYESPNGPQTIHADAVLAATPAFATAKLFQQVVPETSRLSDIPYVSTATVLLAFPKEQVQVDLAASGFVVPRVEKRTITACTWTSTKWPHSTPEGFVLVRCYVGRSGQEEVLHLTDEEILQQVRQDLKRMIGIEAQPAFTKVTRWNHAMPQYRVNHLQLVDEIDTTLHKQAPGLFIAGAAYRGVGIPDCIAQASKAADEIMTFLVQK